MLIDLINQIKSNQISDDGYQGHDDGDDEHDVRPDIGEHLGEANVGSQKVEFIICLQCTRALTLFKPFFLVLM